MSNKSYFSIITLVTIVFFYGCKKEIESSFVKTVQINGQIWMQENLNVDKYRNGDPIPEVKDPKEWVNLKTGAWCYYNNDRKNGEKYGKLYNWYAVNDPRGLAPKGWHIPSKAIFEKLASSVNFNGNSLKALSQGTGSGEGTNTSGFSILIAGYRSNDGYFYNLGYTTVFWSSMAFDATYASGLFLIYNGSGINLAEINKVSGFSVRCCKNLGN